jgi:ABC-2 type transport system permease protein
MRGLTGAAKVGTRIVSQARKELIQIIRSPAAFVSLILGPFLLMALFGLGFTGVRAPLDTALVIPPDVDVPRDAAYYQDISGPALRIETVAETPDDVLRRLAARELDMVVIAPKDAEGALREGRQAEIQVVVNEVDPALDLLARIIAGDLSETINRELITRALEEGEGYVVSRLDDPTAGLSIPPEVLAAPTTATTVNISPTQPAIVSFFAPAILALVLQHMAVTLSALSLVRERLSGTMELFRVSPIGPTELLLGKYLGFAIASALLTVLIMALLIGVLGVPIIGPPLMVVAIIALVIFASLGIGLLISVVADSERQAVLLAMLVLLASVFFSGVVQRVDDLRLPVQLVSNMLPVTHGIALLQDVMLRGGSGLDWHLLVLAASGLLLLLVTALVLRRQFTHAVRA